MLVHLRVAPACESKLSCPRTKRSDPNQGTIPDRLTQSLARLPEAQEHTKNDPSASAQTTTRSQLRKIKAFLRLLFFVVYTKGKLILF